LFDALPEVFGSYRVIEEIGAGRFGPVYRAHDDATGVAAAIKVFDQGLTSDQASRLAVMLERLRDVSLDHAAIAPILAAGAIGDRVWVAEPWFDATPLDVVMRRDGAQPLADVLLRVTQLSGALDFAAAVGVHHGALHPRDILVSGELTVLAGLGVLQALGDAGLVVPMEGAYVSPQRAQGLPVTPRDDIFSLAAITYELAYGAPVPVQSELRAAVTRMPGVDRVRFAEILEGALSSEPDDRPSSALEFAAAIQEALTPIPDSDSRIPIRDSDSHSESPIPVPIPIPVPQSDSSAQASAPDLPLRAGESEFESERTNRNRTSELANRNRESESANWNRESEPEYGWWFLTTATLAIGLLMGFASGYVVGQRDSTPTPQSAQRAVARAQRPSSPDESPTPTAGRDFTESPVPPAASGVDRPAASGVERPQTVTDQPVIPPPESPGRTNRPASSEAARSEGAQRTESPDHGVLQVDSRPRGAQVFVDGRLVGITPLLLTDVRPGTHAVRIDLRGHRRWVTSVEVAPGERQRVAASLER
jgi:serine/threonine protein kinase